MRYTIVTTQELLAALKPSEFRPFIKEAVLSKKYKHYLNHVFKDKDRIYLPFTPDIKVPAKIEEFLSKKNYSVLNYKAGLAKREKGNPIKIGGILSKDEEGKELLDLFNTSRSGSKHDALLVVVSRHPYDVAGMSTGRRSGDKDGWTSCMNLVDGGERKYVHRDIEYGTLVAYIIGPRGDSMDYNIKKPLSRLLIKQFINVDNLKDTILYPEETVYGVDMPGFRNVIIRWLNTFQKMKGTYKLNTCLNNDGLTYVGEGDKYSASAEVRKMYYDLNPDDEEAKEDEYFDIRIKYYKNHPKDKQAREDEELWVRRMYYSNYPDDETAKDDKFYGIRLDYYLLHPDDPQAKEDEAVKIRQRYYREHNNDEQAKKDPDSKIVEQYYATHPKDEQAKDLTNSVNIRRRYYKYNSKDKQAKEDPDPGIREEYYKINKDDPMAKTDTDFAIRYRYYKNHKDDPMAKEDEDVEIRLLYYSNHQDDEQALNDKSGKVRLYYLKNNPEVAKQRNREQAEREAAKQGSRSGTFFN